MYASHKNIRILIQSDIENMSLDIMVQLGIIVNELLTNSIKYAFVDTEGDIRIDFKKNDAEYIFVYRDNGIGYEFPEEILKSKSLGIKLIHLTVKQLKGSIEILNDKGLKYIIRFKL